MKIQKNYLGQVPPIPKDPDSVESECFNHHREAGRKKNGVDNPAFRWRHSKVNFSAVIPLILISFDPPSQRGVDNDRRAQRSSKLWIGCGARGRRRQRQGSHPGGEDQVAALPEAGREVFSDRRCERRGVRGPSSLPPHPLLHMGGDLMPLVNLIHGP